MGWRRLVGSLKSQVLQKIGLFCRALLQKRPIILRSLLIVATPYSFRDMYISTTLSICDMYTRLVDFVTCIWLNLICSKLTFSCLFEFVTCTWLNLLCGRLMLNCLREFVVGTRLVGTVTHSYVWHDSFIYVTWLIHMCDMTRSYVWHDSFIYVTWLIHMCDMTHSYLWHDSSIYVTWLIHICATIRWHRDSSIYVTCLIHEDTIDAKLTNESCHTYEWVMSHV